MFMKKIYQVPDVEVIEFKNEDVITTSGGDNDLENPWGRSASQSASSYWQQN
jgi:hypothetical protein